MEGGAKTLVGLALLAAAAALVTIVWNLAAMDLSSFGDTVVARASAAFEGEGWSLLPKAAAGATIVAAALTIADRVSRIPRPARTTAVQPSDAAGVRDVCREVRARVQELTKFPPDVVAACEELVRGAVRVAASDIHISPTPKGIKLTYRVLGEIHDVGDLAPEAHAPLVTRLKVLARLDTTLRSTPQDGRLTMIQDGSSIEARMSTLPTESGERVVLRLVRGGRTVPDVASLGFSEETTAGLADLLGRPQGLLFVTGPVGSGKTTTLYASLKHIAETRGKTTTLVTLEDPIELELAFATQTQMNPKAGMTFAGTLRSVLRQDPNVLMVGEIRDKETAEIAMQAGLTGHVILTTVHGQSAAGVFARLIDMGVEPFILASATLGCLSQRLVRTLCTACRREGPVGPTVVERFAEQGIVVPDGVYYEPVGCQFCEGQGFAGRLPLAELLVVSEELRQAMSARKPTSDLERLAVAQGMTPLLRDGLERARKGETSLLEVLRVAG